MTIINEILQKINEYKTIIIHRHEMADPDALGSQFGLAEILKFTYKDKEIYQVGDDVGNLYWLSEEQKISDDKYKDALVIVLDTANRERISDKRFKKGKYIIKIDHHPNVDSYGNINFINESASSCAEIIVDIVNSSNGKLHISPNAARLLYAGIVGDTGRFLYPNTTSHTFKIASQLLTFSFNNSDVTQHLNEVTLLQAKLQCYVFNNITISSNGAAYIILSKEKMKELNIIDRDVSSAISTPGHLKNVISWMIFVEQDDKFKYKVHLRSKGPIINGLAMEHNGGGHPLASGAKALNDEEVKQMIESLIFLTEQFRSKN